MPPAYAPRDDAVQPVGLPDADDSQLIGSPFGMSQAAADSLATSIVSAHRKAKQDRRLRDLTAEKYLVHIDGEGDAQWCDIVNGTAVGIPPSLGGGMRWQWNILRPLVNNYVSYFTAIPFRFEALAAQDRASRDKALVDTVFGNSVSEQQRLNETYAQAKFTSAAYGMCPVHVYWRDDFTQAPYEPVYDTEMEEALRESMRAGFPDFFVGDPWDTTFNEGAKRGSVRVMTYARIVPLSAVQKQFGHIPRIDEIQGSTHMPSASRFQRTVRYWSGLMGQSAHGSAAINGHDWDTRGEPLVALLCREIAPGVVNREGMLQIAAVPGSADTDERWALASTHRGILMHNGPLPGKRFSGHVVYSHHRTDDALGKPYVADLDDLQVQLNQLVTMRAEFIRRLARPPLLLQNGQLEDDTVTTEDDAIIVSEGLNTKLEFSHPPVQGLQFVNAAIGETLDQMFRIGGWQAASRGESFAGDPAAKVVALQRADDTIFGPDNIAFRAAVCTGMQTAHALAKERMTVPMLVRMIGEEIGYLAEPRLSRDDLSDEPPIYRMVSGYGTTPEGVAQQLLNMTQMQGADGTPILPVEDFWRMVPDQAIRRPERSSARLRESRAHAVNKSIIRTVEGFRQVLGDQLSPEFAQQLHMFLVERYPVLRDDDLQYHIETLSAITQDEFADPVARMIATMRQGIYFEWWQMQTQGAAAGGRQPAGGGPPGGRGGSVAGGPVASPKGGQPESPNSQAMNPGIVGQEVNRLTSQATGAAA